MSEAKRIELEEKEIYFLLIYERKKTENNSDFEFKSLDNSPVCIFTNKEDKENNIYYKKIFKYIIKKDNINLRQTISAVIDRDDYIIDFNLKDDISFIFDLNLKVKNSFFNFPRDINQNNIQYYEKLNMYIECLYQNNEDEKLDILYKDTIHLYSKKPTYVFLMKLFTKVYQDKNLCPLLLDKFNETKDKENQINSIDKINLESLKDIFKSVFENIDNLIAFSSKKEYLKTFYSIILSFLNIYNYETFLELIEILYKKNKEDLFDILLDYKAYFKNDIKKDFDFFNEFISYSTKKTYDEFIKDGLFYLKNINEYLKVLEFNKEKIILIKKFMPIKIINIDKNINLNINEILKYTEKIISFSEKKKKIISIF